MTNPKGQLDSLLDGLGIKLVPIYRRRAAAQSHARGTCHEIRNAHGNGHLIFTLRCIRQTKNNRDELWSETRGLQLSAVHLHASGNALQRTEGLTMTDLVATERYLKDGKWVSVGSIVEENDAAPEGAVSETDALQLGGDDRTGAGRFSVDPPQITAHEEGKELAAKRAAGEEPPVLPADGAAKSEPASEKEESDPDLDKMSKDELLAEAKVRGVDVKASDTKAEIIEKLKA